MTLIVDLYKGNYSQISNLLHQKVSKKFGLINLTYPPKIYDFSYLLNKKLLGPRRIVEVVLIDPPNQ